MFSEDIITLLESSSYSSASEFKMKLVVSFPNFPIVSKIPSFIISILLNRLIYAPWGQMVLNHQYKAKFENAINNLCILIQSDCIDITKIDCEDFIRWLRNSSVRDVCKCCDELIELIDKKH